jgi:hypothetical protein
MNFPFLKAKERLIRIMGTFDLATGHADTFDELLDSLESELRDVLGHYRAAVKEHLTQEPVAWLDEYGNAFPLTAKQYSVVGKHWKPLYTTPPQRTWVGLTDEDCRGMSAGDRLVAMWADRTLKEKNT